MVRKQEIEFTFEQRNIKSVHVRWSLKGSYQHQSSLSESPSRICERNDE